jgi:four helix bundle protein
MVKYGFEELEFYQLSMKLWDLCWFDSEKIMSDRRGWDLSQQLISAVGSICANIEEGYGSSSTKKYINFLTYSRGSAQEARGWYKKAKFLLPADIIESRISDLELIIGKVTKTISTLRGKLK